MKIWSIIFFGLTGLLVACTPANQTLTSSPQNPDKLPVTASMTRTPLPTKPPVTPPMGPNAIATNGPALLTPTIPTLEQSMPEVIPDEEMKAAQEKLRAEGIEMDYTTSSSAGGGGGGGATFNKLPEGMDQQEAYQHFLNALGYVYPGPWVFTLDIQP